jgi:hypothetical protein
MGGHDHHWIPPASLDPGLGSNEKMINPNVINEGESVTIQDKEKNVIQGPMMPTENGQLAVQAFGSNIVFARWSNSARDGLGGYVVKTGLKIVAHRPPIDQLVIDVLPRQRYQQQQSNPT